jgi:hypothetical protein
VKEEPGKRLLAGACVGLGALAVTLWLWLGLSVLLVSAGWEVYDAGSHRPQEWGRRVSAMLEAFSPLVLPLAGGTALGFSMRLLAGRARRSREVPALWLWPLVGVAGALAGVLAAYLLGLAGLAADPWSARLSLVLTGAATGPVLLLGRSLRAPWRAAGFLAAAAAAYLLALGYLPIDAKWFRYEARLNCSSVAFFMGIHLLAACLPGPGRGES